MTNGIMCTEHSEYCSKRSIVVWFTVNDRMEWTNDLKKRAEHSDAIGQK